MIKLTNYNLTMDDNLVFDNVDFFFGRQTYLLAGQMHKRKSLLISELARAFVEYTPGVDFVLETGIGYLPNNRFLIESLTVKQNLEFFTKFFNIPSIKIKVIINHFELENIANRKVNSLTPDLIQLVRIACVFLNTKASVYLLDNIFNNLNKGQIDLVKNFLKLLEGDNTIIISKLNTHEIEEFNPRIIEIVDKKLVYGDR